MTATFATTTVLVCIALGIVFVKWRAAVRERDAASLNTSYAIAEAMNLSAAVNINENSLRITREDLEDADTELRRLRQRLLLQASRVFPAAPFPGQGPRVFTEGESPIHDELAAARTRKAAAKPTPVRKRAAKGVGSS